LNKKTTEKARREDPELWGTISLLFLIRKHKENGGGRVRSSLEQFPYCLYIYIYVYIL